MTSADYQPRHALEPVASGRAGLWRTLALALVGLLLLGGGLAQLYLRDSDVSIDERVTVSGVPYDVIRPTWVTQDMPAVVLQHGYTSSSGMLRMLATGIARAGYVVAVLDAPGHGRNPNPLEVADTEADPDPQADNPVVDAMRDVVAEIALDPFVQRSAGVALVGHSMGAIAVAAMADDPLALRPAAIVPISLPSADAMSSSARVPTLAIYGAWEPQQFVTASNDVVANLTQRNVAAQVTVVPNTEHISVVYSQVTAKATIDWLDVHLPSGQPDSEVSLTTPIPGLLAALVGMVVLLFPLARWLFPTPPAAPVGAPARWSLSILIVAGVIAGGVGMATGAWQDRVPMAVAGYLIGWLLTVGVVAGLARRILRRRGVLPADNQQPDPSVWRTSVATLALTALAVAVIALSAQVSWSTFDLVGPRRTILPMVEAAFLTFFFAEELLVRRADVARRLGMMLLHRGVIAGLLLAAVPLAGAPSILVLQVPLIAVLFGVTAIMGVAVARVTSEVWPVVTVQAIPMSYVVATSLPLIG